MRHTVRGIIIRDRKVLLVTGHGADFYWTPGGGVEAGESSEETLHREIREELGVDIAQYAPYFTYEYEDQHVENYRIELAGDIQIGNEITHIAWYDSSSDVVPSNGAKAMILARLRDDDLID